MKTVVYDLETYPNLFTICFKLLDGSMQSFEISDRLNQGDEIREYVNNVDRMIGFNNIGFDWPILKLLIQERNVTAYRLYQMADIIIQSEDRFSHIDWNPSIEQLDLYRIHHFDNRAKATSLKVLEFNMRMHNIRDLPYKPGEYIPKNCIDNVLLYNAHDVMATEKFYLKSLDKIRLRENLNHKWLNYSDTKIGTQYVIDRLIAAGIQCYQDVDGRRRPRQTKRPEGVRLNDVIFPFIKFETETLQTLHRDIEEQVIVETRSAFSRVFEFHGVKVTFGLGGLHGAVKRRKYTSGRIIDLDVKGYYPAIIAEHNVYPEHLGHSFCQIIGDIIKKRDNTESGSDANKTFKLAGNSVFGQTNSEFGVFFDPACMLGITINGQLMMLKLAEMVLQAPEIDLIQINTDGMTIHIPDEYDAQPLLEDIEVACKQWCEETKMTLKTREYEALFIRDVNNYIGKFPDGERIRKGAFQSSRDWHQNHSALVVPKGAEAFLLDDVNPDTFVMLHDDPWDFMHRIKINRNSELRISDGSVMNGVVRYYLSEQGYAATKHMPKTTTRLHAGGYSTPAGKRGDWTCPECGFHSKRKAEVQAHIEAEHSSKLVVSQAYEGQPIAIDTRAYVAAINELVRDFK